MTTHFACFDGHYEPSASRYGEPARVERRRSMRRRRREHVQVEVIHSARVFGENAAVVVCREGLGCSLCFSRAMRRMSSGRDVRLPQAVGVLRPPPLRMTNPARVHVCVAKGEVRVALGSLRIGASPRSSSPNTVGFFSMSSASGKFVVRRLAGRAGHLRGCEAAGQSSRIRRTVARRRARAARPFESCSR